VSAPVEVIAARDDGDATVGTLYPSQRRGVGTATFVHADTWLSDPSAYPLDPALPLVSGHIPTPVDLPLFNAMRDCAPDRWGRTLLARLERLESAEQARTPRALSEVDLLLGVRDDLRTGALRFRTGPDGPFLAPDDRGVPALVDLGAMVAAADDIESDVATIAEVRRLVRAGSSLGGARPKAHVRTADGRLAIAKFPSRANDEWDVMAWEKVALDLAALAGIDVPESELLRVDGRSVLVVERFDRRTDGARVGYRSALTMLEAREGETRSYLDLAEAIEQHSPAASEDLAELWRRIVFSVLIANTDDHLRNHAFLHAGGTAWRLSPAFDLNPDPAPGPLHLSTAIDEVRTDASVDLALAVAPAFRLERQAAEHILAEVRRAIERWPDVARRHGLDRRERDRMTPAFTADR
jgi:serine/threonine-protein kinase HipA